MLARLLALGALALAKPLTIDLETNWAQSPFKVQLLETLAGYNASAYFPLLSIILTAEEAENRQLSDIELYELGISNALSNSFLSEGEVPLVKADLALGTWTAAIETKFSDFNYDLQECENVLVYNGKATCDSGAVFALETDAVSDVELLETDRMLGSSPNAPWAILYGDLSTNSFPVFHANLLASALEGKINYILRYKPSSTSQLQRLGGYGATVQVKRTDYLVVDDRDREGDLKLDVDAPNKLEKRDLPKLSHRLTTAILKSKDRFATLKDYVLNLPSHLAAVKDVKPSAKLKHDAEENGRAFFGPGTNALVVNGAAASSNGDYNVYQLLDVLKQELEAVIALEKFVDTETARTLITSGVAEMDTATLTSDTAAEPRFDYRSDAVIWINDLEKSQIYQEYPKALTGVVGNQDQLLTLSRNIHNVVVAVDLDNVQHLQLVAQLFQIVSRKAPFRVGIVPIGSGERAANFIEVAQLGSFFARQKYLVQLIESLDASVALREAHKYQSDGSVDPRSSDLADTIKQWLVDFDVAHSILLVNGVLVPVSQEWIYNAMEVLVSDDERLKQAVADGKFDALDTESDLEEFVLGERLLKSRDPLVDPVDPSLVDYISTSSLYDASFGYIAEWNTKMPAAQTLWVVGDVTSEQGTQQVIEALKLAEATINVKVLPVLDGERIADSQYRKSVNSMLEQGQRPALVAKIALEAYQEHVFNKGPRPKFYNNVTEFLGKDQMTHLQRTFHVDSKHNRFSPHAVTLIVDGRVVQSPEVVSVERIQALLNRETPRVKRIAAAVPEQVHAEPWALEQVVSQVTATWFGGESARVVSSEWAGQNRTASAGGSDGKRLEVVAVIDPISETAQSIVALLDFVERLDLASIKVFFSPKDISLKGEPKIPNRYYKGVFPTEPEFKASSIVAPSATFENLEDDVLYVVGVDEPAPWVVMTRSCDYDLDNVILNTVDGPLFATYELRSLLVEGSAVDLQTSQPPRGAQLELVQREKPVTDTMVMANLGYYQLQANPGHYELKLKGASESIFDFVYARSKTSSIPVRLTTLQGTGASFGLRRQPGKEDADPAAIVQQKSSGGGWLSGLLSKPKKQADINIFTVASGHLYERFASIMSLSVMKHTKHTVKFWLIENFLSPSFKQFVPVLAEKYGFEYEFVTYKWPNWLRAQTEKQREIWGYKILFLDVLFPQSLDKVMFVDSDQIVRTDLIELVNEDLEGAPYGYTPMGEDREETEGFRFWKQGYWKSFLKDKKYHISALYVVDLERFREMGAGDLLRQHYQQLSADPESLANLDQDLPNNLQRTVPIHSLSQDWLWCETWCSDEGLRTAKTIDLCNNPLTKEPKLDRARRQIPEWQVYDDEVAELRASFSRNLAASKTDAPPAQPVEDDDADEHYEL